jgi:hypothetical protein
MLTHRCLDPQDPYAEREVRVAFEWAADHPCLIAALDEHEADILPFTLGCLSIHGRAEIRLP